MSSIDGASFIVTTRFITCLISHLFQYWTQDKYTFGRCYWFAGTRTNQTTLLVMTNTLLKKLDRYRGHSKNNEASVLQNGQKIMYL